MITHTWIEGSALWYRFKSQWKKRSCCTIMHVPITQMSHKSFCSNFNGMYSDILPIPPTPLHRILHFFQPSRSRLVGKFSNDEEVKTFIQNYFANLGTQFYQSSIQKLVSRYDKCMNLFGAVLPIEHTKISLKVR